MLFVPLVAAWLIPASVARVHEKDVPEIVLVGVYVNALPLIIAGGAVLLLNKGEGFTFTVTF